jgi:hypothetical protein
VALGKRRIKQAKLVLRRDPALHPDVDYEAYIAAGYDWGKLKFVDGQRPTVFTCKPLTVPQREALMEQTSFARFVFRCGVVALDNYVDEDTTLPPVARAKEEGFGMMVSDAWYDGAEIPDDDLLNVVKCIQEITQAKAPLPAPSVKPSGQDGGNSKSEATSQP